MISGGGGAACQNMTVDDNRVSFDTWAARKQNEQIMNTFAMFSKSNLCNMENIDLVGDLILTGKDNILQNLLTNLKKIKFLVSCVPDGCHGQQGR